MNDLGEVIESFEKTPDTVAERYWPKGDCIGIVSYGDDGRPYCATILERVSPIRVVNRFRFGKPGNGEGLRRRLYRLGIREIEFVTNAKNLEHIKAREAQRGTTLVVDENYRVVITLTEMPGKAKYGRDDVNTT